MNPPVEFDPALVEAAVGRAVRGHRLEPRYRVDRELCYREPDAERRETAFRALDLRLFEELELDRPFRRAAARLGAVSRVAITRAPSPRAEGADLFARTSADQGETKAVGIALTPERMADPAATEALLVRELRHIDDLLDPGFGFDRAQAAGLPPVTERYRLLWRTSVSGRLHREGRLGAGERDTSRRELGKVFPPGAAEALLERLFDGERPTHAELLDLAERGPEGHRKRAGSRCPLCHFPSHSNEPHPEQLRPGVTAAIRSDFPAWQPADGLCVQCAEIYRGIEAHA